MRKAYIRTIASSAFWPECVVAYLSGITQPPLPPAFNPPTNPYPNGIYAEGIVESDQPSGENINVYPEVSGTVKADPGRRRPGGQERDGSAGDRRFDPEGHRRATAIAGAGRLHASRRTEGSAEKRNSGRGGSPGRVRAGGLEDRSG